MTAALRVLGTLGLVLWMSACAGTPPPPGTPPVRQLEQVLIPGEPRPVEGGDRFEGWNRGVYNFNAQFDRYVFLPVLEGYRFITPAFVRAGFRNFFSNLTEISTFGNSLLQLRPMTAARAATRFMVNTMFTLGFYDLAASADGGPTQVREDFGQTLGRWGAGPGPYLVLPIIGPSNVRDTAGLITDTVAQALLTPQSVSDTTAYKVANFGLQPIVKRDSIAFRYFETGSPFEYELVRLLYNEMRVAEIAR